MIVLVILIGALIRGSVWGIATNAIIANKGYAENWFWWGFFFGWIALVVACTKPRNNTIYSQYPGIGATPEIRRERDLINGNGWKCNQCGMVHPSYTGSCGCGMSRTESEAFQKENI